MGGTERGGLALSLPRILLAPCTKWRENFQDGALGSQNDVSAHAQRWSKGMLRISMCSREWIVVAVNLCQKFSIQISFMEIFDELTELTSPVGTCDTNNCQNCNSSWSQAIDGLFVTVWGWRRLKSVKLDIKLVSRSWQIDWPGN